MTAATAPEDARGFWVFGYGSLMWRPGFDYLERRMARLEGYRRRFALESEHYRGTPERPGLVLGLDWAPGESCIGMAFRVCPTREAPVRGYLAERELVTRSYFEIAHPVHLLPEAGDAGRTVQALAYVLDRSHRQYRGDLSLEEQARIIAAASGPMGSNADYLRSTVTHLAEIGVEDPELVRLHALVDALAA